jgi:hypothetical protein
MSQEHLMQYRITVCVLYRNYGVCLRSATGWRLNMRKIETSSWHSIGPIDQLTSVFGHWMGSMYTFEKVQSAVQSHHRKIGN